MPDDIIARVQSELAKLLQRDEMKRILADLKAEAVVNIPLEFEREYAQERAMWNDVIRKAGVTLE